MELFIFARFHVRADKEGAALDAINTVLPLTRAEKGCLSIHSFQSTHDPRLFYIHSRWIDEAAFETHAGLPHTVRFVETMELLIDHPFEATRTVLIG